MYLEIVAIHSHFLLTSTLDLLLRCQHIIQFSYLTRLDHWISSAADGYLLFVPVLLI